MEHVYPHFEHLRISPELPRSAFDDRDFDEEDEWPSNLLSRQSSYAESVPVHGKSYEKARAGKRNIKNDFSLRESSFQSDVWSGERALTRSVLNELYPTNSYSFALSSPLGDQKYMYLPLASRRPPSIADDNEEKGGHVEAFRDPLDEALEVFRRLSRELLVTRSAAPDHQKPFTGSSPLRLSPVFENCLAKAVALHGLAKAVPSDSIEKRALLHLSYASLAACVSLAEMLEIRSNTGAASMRTMNRERSRIGDYPASGTTRSSSSDRTLLLDLTLRASRLESLLISLIHGLSSDRESTRSLSSGKLIKETCAAFEDLFPTVPKVKSNCALCIAELQPPASSSDGLRLSSLGTLTRVANSLRSAFFGRLEQSQTPGSVRKLNSICRQRRVPIVWELNIMDQRVEHRSPCRCRVLVGGELAGAGEGSRPSTAKERAAESVLANLDRTPRSSMRSLLPRWASGDTT